MKTFGKCYTETGNATTKYTKYSKTYDSTAVTFILPYILILAMTL